MWPSARAIPACIARAAALAAALAAAPLVLAAPVLAQDAAVAETAGRGEPIHADWALAIGEASAALADPDTPTPELQAQRDRLVRLRSAAIDAEAATTIAVADVNARLAALGPPPAEGATEPAEIAERRLAVQDELAKAQLPLLEAQDFQRRADAAIRDIDRLVRSRLAEELRARGPTPLRPSHWVTSFETTAAVIRRYRDHAAQVLADPASRAALLHRVPLDIALVLVGLGIAFGLRRKLTNWTEDRLFHAERPGAIALLVNLRNFSRLIVPAVGAGLLYAALNPVRLFDPEAKSAAETVLFDLPDFLLVIIGAGWLGSSLYAPRLPSYRIVPVSDAEAAQGDRLTMALGLLLAVHLAFYSFFPKSDLSPVETSTLAFPVFVLGGVLLWRTSRLIRTIRKAYAKRAGSPSDEDKSGLMLLRFVGFLGTATLAVAAAVPVLAALGFYAAASYFTFGAIMTLGLLGSCAVVYDVVVRTLGLMGPTRGDGPPEAGRESLMPVAVAAGIMLLATGPLALIWGARGSDLSSLWFMARDGVVFGGMRISLGTIATFAMMFAVVFGITKLLQGFLRGTVLPRTRMDAGGKNAVLAGVGYTGFFLAVVAAVSSTGLDLTSLAVVAGALSVGIGFGLQNIVSNFVSGIILLVERPIKEGDWIEVGGNMGYVRDISVRSTQIETFDRATLILPNSDLVAGTVLNRTHTGMSGRLTVPVGVSYASDPRHVERVLLAIAEEHPMVLMDPEPRVLFMGFGPDSLNFEIRCWLRDVNFSLSARSDMNFDIVERFRAEGISIPFPQREIRFRGVDLRAALRSGAGEDPPHGDQADPDADKS